MLAYLTFSGTKNIVIKITITLKQTIFDIKREILWSKKEENKHSFKNRERAKKFTMYINRLYKNSKA